MESVKEGLATERYYASLQQFKTLLARKVTGPRKDQRAALDLVDQAFDCCTNPSCAADVAGSVFGVLEAFHVPLSDNLLALLLKFADGIVKLPEGLNPSIAFLQEAIKYIQRVGYGDCTEQVVDSVVRRLSDRIFSRWCSPSGTKEDLLESLVLASKVPEAGHTSKLLSDAAGRLSQPEATQIFFAFFLRVVSTAVATERFRGASLRRVVAQAVEPVLQHQSLEHRFVKAFAALLDLDRDERASVAQPFVSVFGKLLAQYGQSYEALLVRGLSQ